MTCGPCYCAPLLCIIYSYYILSPILIYVRISCFSLYTHGLRSAFVGGLNRILHTLQSVSWLQSSEINPKWHLVNQYTHGKRRERQIYKPISRFANVNLNKSNDRIRRTDNSWTRSAVSIDCDSITCAFKIMRIGLSLHGKQSPSVINLLCQVSNIPFRSRFIVRGLSFISPKQ